MLERKSLALTVLVNLFGWLLALVGRWVPYAARMAQFPGLCPGRCKGGIRPLCEPL